MRTIRAVLIDLSGTLHVEDQLIPGAVEALIRLRQASPSLKLKFVTNTTKESRARLCKRLQSLGFDIKESEMHTSLSVARSIVQQKGLNPLMFLEPEAMEEFDFLENMKEKKQNAVLIGLNPERFEYKYLNQAFSLIKNEGAPLIAIHKNRYFRKKSGLALGPGPFVVGLEYATGVKAQVVGKPEETFFRKALDDLGCSPGDAVMIGDDPFDDIAGAQRIGIRGILVRTGKYCIGDERKPGINPYQVADSFVQAVDFILQTQVTSSSL